MVARVGLYKGYSSFEFDQIKTFKLNDLELVKMDLLNHIFTRRGERVMMSNFGTQIPDLTFEPLDETTLEIIHDELTYVFNYDPRVEILELNVIPDYDNNAVFATARLFYVEFKVDDTMDLRIDFKE